MLLIDASNISASLSETAVHLIDLLNYLQSKKKVARILIIYSKVDIIQPSENRKRVISSIQQLLRISYLKFWYGKISIKEIEYSAVTGQGVDKICYWLNHSFLY